MGQAHTPAAEAELAAPGEEEETPDGAAGSAAAPPPARLDGLTALRAVAATAVVLYHLNGRVFGALGLPHYIPFVDRYYLGVDLFFILSGFILAHVRGREFAQPRPTRALRFYILRLARIYPVHAAMLALYLALFLAYDLVGRAHGIEIRLPGRYSARGFFEHLLLISADRLSWNFPAWSVSAEWFAYLWFPLLAALLLRAPRGRALLLLGALTAGFAAVYAGDFDGNMNHVGLVRVGFEFTAGMLIHRICFDAPLRRLLPGLAAVLLGAALLLDTRFADFGSVLALGAAIALFGRERRALPWLRPPRLLLRLGEISYSLYMAQSLVIAAAGRLTKARLEHLPPRLALLLVPAALLAAFLAAELLHRLVENPGRDWLKLRLLRLATGLRGRFRVEGIYEATS